MRDRRAGPENGLFFPILARPNKMLWRMKGGDKPGLLRLPSVQRGKRALHTNSATGSEQHSTIY